LEKEQEVTQSKKEERPLRARRKKQKPGFIVERVTNNHKTQGEYSDAKNVGMRGKSTLTSVRQSESHNRKRERS